MSDTYLATFYWLVYTFSVKSDEVLILSPNCLNLDFRYKIFNTNKNKIFNVRFVFSTFKLTNEQIFKGALMQI